MPTPNYLVELQSNILTPSKVGETEVKSTLGIISIKLKISGAGKHQQTDLAMLFSSSSLQAGPEAYTSDAPQPRGILCNPGTP